MPSSFRRCSIRPGMCRPFPLSPRESEHSGGSGDVPVTPRIRRNVAIGRPPMSARAGFSTPLRLTILAALAAWLVLLFPAATLARMLGDTGAAYSADRLLTVGGQHFDGVVYAIPGYQRHEQTLNGIQQVAIFDLAA